MKRTEHLKALVFGDKTNTPEYQTRIATGASFDARRYFLDRERTKENLLLYEKIYSSDGVISEAVDATALFCVMQGYRIESNDQNAKKDVQTFLDKVDFENVLIKCFRDPLIFGDAFAEKVYSRAGIPADIKMIHPATMNMSYDEYGNILKYIQEITQVGSRKRYEIDPKYISHFVVKSVSGKPYGISFIGVNLDMIKRMVKADEGIANAIHRHGFRKYHIKVGREGEFVDQNKLEDVEKDFEDINNKNEFVTTKDVDIITLDEGGLTIKELSDYFITKVTAGMGVPEEILGLGRGSTEATAKVRMTAFEHKIKAYQLGIARTFELELFNALTLSRLKSHDALLGELCDKEKAMRYLDGVSDVRELTTDVLGEKNKLADTRRRITERSHAVAVDNDIRVRLVFNDISPEDEKDKAEWLTKLMPQLDPFMVLSREEIRARMGLGAYPDEIEGT